ncbi:hypothetical protein PIB30_011397, partial [Stylosanthes scabra]|nr:hypothetical protein [Stylosanthes scabra]
RIDREKGGEMMNQYKRQAQNKRVTETEMNAEGRTRQRMKEKKRENKNEKSGGEVTLRRE